MEYEATYVPGLQVKQLDSYDNVGVKAFSLITYNEGTDPKGPDLFAHVTVARSIYSTAQNPKVTFTVVYGDGSIAYAIVPIDYYLDVSAHTIVPHVLEWSEDE